MKKTILLPIILLFSIGTTLVSCDEDGFNVTPNDGLSNDEIIQGLKEALTKGADTSVSILSVTDGYYADQAVKILLPPEGQKIYGQLEKIPGVDELVVEGTVKLINRAAEDASTEAKPIFKDAITNITITDGLSILQGHDSSATMYLKDNTYDNLMAAYTPKMEASLGKPIVGSTSAESSYQTLVSSYNAASLGGLLYPKIQETTLSAYATARALDGLFKKVALEEGKIRKDPLHRVTDILKKVFSSLD